MGTTIVALETALEWHPTGQKGPQRDPRCMAYFPGSLLQKGTTEVSSFRKGTTDWEI